MTSKEIDTAKKLLADRCERTEVVGSDTEGGLSLTAYWTDGGQKLFHTISQVSDHVGSHTPHDYLAALDRAGLTVDEVCGCDRLVRGGFRVTLLRGGVVRDIH